MLRQDDTATGQTLLGYFPPRLRPALEPYLRRRDLTEIRLRIHQPLQLKAPGMTLLPVNVTCADCDYLFEAVCEHSVYAWANELKEGFLTLPGGCRVGMAGRGVVEDGIIRRIQAPTFFNVRVAREWVGCGNAALEYLVDESGGLRHTLVLSPPGCGKTTLLRDLARSLSYRRRNVCVVDERSEITGSREGIPGCDLGPCCDVLDGCPKSQGMLFALRVMSPEVLVCDELGRPEEMQAVYAATQCGCAVLASAHARDTGEFRRRFCALFQGTALPFERYVILDDSGGPGTLLQVEDGNGAALYQRGGRKNVHDA